MYVSNAAPAAMPLSPLIGGRVSVSEARSLGRTALTVLVDIALVVAVLLLVRLVVGFFGVTAVNPVGRWYLRLTAPLAVPVAGDWEVRTPYGGVFAVDAGILIIGALVVEWALARLRSRLYGPGGSGR